MTKKITFSLIAAFIAVFISTIMFEKPAISNATGAPSATTGYTGSPIDGGHNCSTPSSGCHTGTATTVTGWITSNIPGAGYVGGTTYSITVTVTGTGNKGFEVFAQNATAAAGTLIAASGSHTVGGGTYITHSYSSTASANPKTWTFSWTAPAAGTGTVTFYGAFAISQSTTKLSTLVVPEHTTGINETSVQIFTLYPNPVKDNLFLNYTLTSDSKVELNLYAIDGQKIASLLDENQSTGDHSEQLNLTSSVLPGIYLAYLKIGDKSTIQKIVVE